MQLSFLTPVVLGGLALVAVPIVIHLIMRRKPKHLTFPAFRFLQMKHKTNMQKLRLRHILLLALRLLIIATVAMALARPLLSGGPAQLSTDDPLGVVLVFDTSPSMDYEIDGHSRLDAAKEQALRWLEYLPAGSEVAVVDTAEAGVQFANVRDAAQLIRNRRSQPLNRPVTASLEEVYRYLEKSAPELPIVVTIFSDRTAASWQSDGARSFVAASKARLEEKLGRPIPSVYVDLGATEPRNVTITALQLKPADSDLVQPLENVPYGTLPRQPQLQAVVQITGTTVDSDVLLLVNGRQVDSKRLTAKAQPGQTVTEIVTFKPIELQAGATQQLLQGEVRLKNVDLLPADNVRYWSLALTQRKALIIADEPADAFAWSTALQSLPQLPLSTEIVTPAQVPARLHPDQQQIVSLLNVAAPTAELWDALREYVAAGGGLIVLPGADAKPEAYGTESARALLPAKLAQPVEVASPGTFLAPENYDHPITAFFKTWERQTLPGRVFKIWAVVEPSDESVVVFPYEHENRPALMERVLDPKRAKGRVLLFTTTLYRRNDRQWKDWNTFHDNWMALALPYLMSRHVVGAREERLNFTLRDDVRFWLPQGSGFNAYALSGPETGLGEIKLDQEQVVVTEARRPGNYRVSDPGGESWRRSFSMNLPAAETQLFTDRPTPETIAALLGPDSVHSSHEGLDLRALTRASLGQTPKSELLPYLMILVVLFFAAENLLANRFYRKVE